MAPVRTTPLHHLHAGAGASFAPAGQWLRAQGYPKDGETLEQATMREAKHVREKVGIVDVSTLGKIDVQGPDALEFLNRVYINSFSNLTTESTFCGFFHFTENHGTNLGRTVLLSIFSSNPCVTILSLDNVIRNSLCDT